jgi:hypothetical protein
VSLGLPSETIIVNSTRIRCRWNEIIHSLQFGDFEYNYSTLFHPSYSISSAVANISRSLLVPSRTSNPFLSYIQTPMVANTILLDLNFERQVLDDDTVTKTKMVTNKISAAKVTFPFSSPKVSPRPSSLIQLPPSSEREFFLSHTYEWKVENRRFNQGTDMSGSSYIFFDMESLGVMGPYLYSILKY